MTAPKGVSSTDLAWIRRSLQSILPDVKIFVFGSRVGIPNNPHSDLDLALLNQNPISFLELSKIKEVFSESKLLYKVDLVDLNNVDESFKSHILKTGIEI